MDLTLDDVAVLRAAALRDGFIALQESVADAVLELIGDLPEHIKIITLTDYSRWAVQSPERPPAAATGATEAEVAELQRLRSEAKRRGLL
jgi:hypothetical protein